MKNYFKMIVAIVLMLCIAFSLVACGENEEDNIVAVEETPIPSAEPEIEYDYSVTLVDLPYEQISLQDSTFAKDGWYTIQYENDIPIICKIDLEGNVTKLESYKVVQGDGSKEASFFSDIKGIAASDNYLITIETLTKTEIIETEDSSESVTSNKCFARTVDKSLGEVIEETEISLAEGESIYPRTAKCDANGNMYVASSLGIEEISADETLKLYSEGKNVHSLIRLGNGTIATTVLQDDNLILTEVDSDSEDTILAELPTNINSLSDGNNQYDFYYTGEMNLYGYKLSSNEEIALLNWTELGLKADNLSSLGSVDETKLYALYNDEANEKAQLVVITRSDSEGGKQATEKTITLVSLNPSDELQQAVVNFNKTNDKVNVKLVTIEAQESDDLNIQEIKNYAALNNDGQMPDIIDMTGLPISQFYAEGYAEDLSNYLGKYKDDLFTPVLNALSYDGKVYGVAEGFTLTTVTGNSSLVGDDNSFSIDEYKALLSNSTDMVPMGQGSVRNAALWDYVGLTLDKYINWANFTCDYSNDEFISILEVINALGNFEETESAATLINEGKQFLKRASLNTFDDIITAGYEFGDNVSYVGYPMASGSGNILCVVTPLSISTESENKDEAWEFISSLLTEEHQKDNWCFPSNKAAFEAGLAKAQTEITETDESGTEVKVIRGITFAEDLTPNEIYAISSNQAEKLLEIVNNIDNVFEDNNTIYEIISNVANQYFNGEMNSDVAAATIQEMVSTYLSSMK